VTAVQVGTRSIEVSHADKILFPNDGITKSDVVEYYRRVADWMLPHLVDRPLALHRFPDGVERSGFFQKQTPDYFPDWIETVTLERERGGKVTHVVCSDAATLVYLANQAVIVLHRLLAARSAPRKAVELVLDLDPPRDDPRLVVHAARLVRDLLDELDVVAFAKSTGSKGLHVHVPLDGTAGFDDVRELAHALAADLVDRDPDRLTIEHRKNARHGRLFVDWLRNGYGQHAVAPFTLRAVPGAPVATPLGWDEATARGFDPRRFRLANVFRRIGRKQDPWAEIDRVGYSARDLSARFRSR
jgi:bifunctional non-homologous end joining protein LigD